MERRDGGLATLAGASSLLLVGAGKMGGAMLDRWLAGLLPASAVAVLDPMIDEHRRGELVSRGVTLASEPAELENGAFGILVLAVKPQAMASVLPAVAPLAGPATTVLSIAAGTKLAQLQAAFPAGQPVVRAMPNTPAQIGLGMSVAVADPNVPAEGRAAIDALLAAIGEVAWVEDEGLIDSVTAVSGSGPAYVFLLAECLAEAGRQAGLPAELAAQLARQTVVGAGALLGASPFSAAKLREDVTSPNGTTAAALAMLMAEDGLQPLLTRAVEAARRRSVELG